jgi:hypothetical protein
MNISYYQYILLVIQYRLHRLFAVFYLIISVMMLLVTLGKIATSEIEMEIEKWKLELMAK